MRREEIIHMLARDCVHFKGDRPCQPHQHHGAMCRCPAYTPRGEKVLAIQLGGPARVIQAQALVRRLKADQPDAHLTFLTTLPELLCDDVDLALPFDAASLACLQTDPFDRVYNLDMDRRACAITNMITAGVKKGFFLRQGHCMPMDADSQAAYLRAVLPQACEDAAPCPVHEIFITVGVTYRLEMPRLRADESVDLALSDDDMAVALHTQGPQAESTGDNWPEAHWAYLAKLLMERQITPILLGDAAADGRNRRIARKSNAVYIGPMSWREIISATGRCASMVTTSPTGAVLAVALGKPAVAIESAPAQRATRDLYRGRALAVHPVQVSSAAPAIGDVLPDQILEALASRVKLPRPQPKTVPHRLAPPDVAELLDLVAARSVVSQSRQAP